MSLTTISKLDINEASDLKIPSLRLATKGVNMGVVIQ